MGDLISADELFDRYFGLLMIRSNINFCLWIIHDMMLILF